MYVYLQTNINIGCVYAGPRMFFLKQQSLHFSLKVTKLRNAFRNSDTLTSRGNDTSVSILHLWQQAEKS